MYKSIQEALDQLITLTDAAIAMDTNRSHINYLCNTGQIEHYKIYSEGYDKPSIILIKEDSLVDYFLKQKLKKR